MGQTRRIELLSCDLILDELFDAGKCSCDGCSETAQWTLASSGSKPDGSDVLHQAAILNLCDHHAVVCGACAFVTPAEGVDTVVPNPSVISSNANQFAGRISGFWGRNNIYLFWNESVSVCCAACKRCGMSLLFGNTRISRSDLCLECARRKDGYAGVANRDDGVSGTLLALQSQVDKLASITLDLQAKAVDKRELITNQKSMEESVSDTKLTDRVRGVVTQGSYRSAVTQLVRMVREPLAKGIAARMGDKRRAAFVAGLLRSDLGDAVLRVVMGVVLERQSIPLPIRTELRQALAQECLVSGATVVTDAVAEMLFGPLREGLSALAQGGPIAEITDALRALDEPQATTPPPGVVVEAKAGNRP